MQYFATGRVYDQIRNSICYPNLNVKICATHAGITVGEDGATHQMLEDINLMRGLPNMTVISPSDDTQSKWAVKEAAKIKIEILNGSDSKTKFNKAKEALEDLGYEVTTTPNNSTTSKSTIINKTGVDSKYIDQIKQKLGVENISSGSVSSKNVDITIIIGKDYE